MKLDLSIIIVNFNTKEILNNCLKSIWMNTRSINFEVIVVDNGSTDGSKELLKGIEKEQKNLSVIYSKQNTGFSKGNNLGITKSRGRYILLLNSDTLLIENTFKKMVDWMDEHPDIGISTCQLLNTNKTLQPSGGYFPSIGRIILWSLLLDDLPVLSSLGSFHPKPGEFYKNDHEQDWVTGAFMIIRDEVLEKVKGLDENIFMYGEELEMCYRAKQAGWKIFYTTKSKIIHIGNASGGSKNALLGEYKGLKYFYKQHKSTMEQHMLSLFLKIGSLLRMIIFPFIPSKKGVASVYAEAFRIS